MNLLLVLITLGVVSDAVLNSGNGENSFEFLGFRGSLTNDCLPTRFPFYIERFEVV